MKYLIILIFILLLFPGVNACKDIIATNDATAGDYNLLLKVRDPSRPGLQVVCMVNKGYEYDYHHPWSGKEMHFVTNHKYIGVATKGDVPPNIVKAGMALNDAGVAYGDADSPSYWINPSKNAWDDFDWIRYSCQNASDEEEAVDYLIDVVEMHAPGVAENLFVVGPERAYIIEADAYHYNVKEVNGIAVMSNYPKELWDKRFLKKIFISSSFDKTFEGDVRKGKVIRLGSLLGVRILNIGDGWISARQIPFGEKVMIKEGEGRRVGYFYVKLLNCYGRMARVSVCYEYYAWENEMMGKIRQKYGFITPQDMMNWSRLHSYDLNNLRGMCEGEEKAAMVFKIPTRNADIMGMGWFAPDQCASIFIPIHIASKDIASHYKSGEASELAKEILHAFGENASKNFKRIEEVFIKENEQMEKFVLGNEENASDIFTISDKEMQNQAYIMEEMYLRADDKEREAIINIWENDYLATLKNIKSVISSCGEETKKNLASLASSICKGRAEIAKKIKNDGEPLKEWEKGNDVASEENYEKSIDYFINAYEKADAALFSKHVEESFTKRSDYAAIIFGVLIAGALIFLLIKKNGLP